MKPLVQVLCALLVAAHIGLVGCGGDGSASQDDIPPEEDPALIDDTVGEPALE